MRERVPLPACGVQLGPELGAAPRNAERVGEEIRLAAAEGARLVVFPEAALTGYVFESRGETLAAAVVADGPELETLARACRESGTWSVCGAIEREEEALFNAAFLIGPEGVVGRYRKIHTLCLGADRFTRAGDGPFCVFRTPVGRIGIHICYDGGFPESARALRLAGAQLILLPTNWPDLTLKRELVRVRAEENHVHYFAVNRVGVERGVRFEGGSCAADPRGRLLLEAGAEPGRYHVAFDLVSVERSRIVVTPGVYEYDRIADRRPDRYRALVESASGGERTGGLRARE